MEYHDLIDNAKEGIKELMHTDNITISKMESDDWKFFFDLLGVQIEEKEERQSLDNEIGAFLEECQNEVAKEKKQKDIESVTKGTEQLSLLTESQNKKM